MDAPDPDSAEVQINVVAGRICGTDVITATGEAVSRFNIGDRVAVEPNIPCNNCQGGMAESVCVPESAPGQIFSGGRMPMSSAVARIRP
ncbi:MAG: hypothetical protein E4H09_01785 [Spirochaetales bacterium]|nr:MAG: hypothetical protein E4H09_01785 [Spirochaetales bacterium]